MQRRTAQADACRKAPGTRWPGCMRMGVAFACGGSFVCIAEPELPGGGGARLLWCFSRPG